MSGKKTEVMRFRISSEDKKEILDLAEAYDEDVSDLLRKTIARLARASREHGERLIWPPKFDYLSGQSAGDIRREQETLLIAAEDAGPKYGEKKRAG